MPVGPTLVPTPNRDHSTCDRVSVLEAESLRGGCQSQLIGAWGGRQALSAHHPYIHIDHTHAVVRLPARTHRSRRYIITFFNPSTSVTVKVPLFKTDNSDIFQYFINRYCCLSRIFLIMDNCYTVVYRPTKVVVNCLQYFCISWPISIILVTSE